MVKRAAEMIAEANAAVGTLSVEEAKQLVGRDDVVFVDVRGGPRDARIPGARHLDLGDLGEAALAGWPPEAEFVTYCACPNDVSAARAAQWLKARGYQARVLRGGIDAWQQAGLALEAG